MRTLKNTIYLALIVGIVGCKDQKKNETMETETQIQEVTETSKAPSITLEKLEGSPAYLDAALGMKQPASGEIKGVDETSFSFTVENYELGVQTTGPNAEILANSSKGQHIHFILNNQPYSAHYEPDFKKELPEGVHHLVAFLSRSYHESVKNPNSMVVKKLTVGNNPEDAVGLDISAPTLIYSRPKGTYKGKETENLLLDFFVLNTTLSEDGNKVRATINGQEFMITEWAPQIIKGLPKGEVSIDLALIDAKGDHIPGPFNKVSRTVMLAE